MSRATGTSDESLESAPGLDAGLQALRSLSFRRRCISGLGDGSPPSCTKRGNSNETQLLRVGDPSARAWVCCHRRSDDCIHQRTTRFTTRDTLLFATLHVVLAGCLVTSAPCRFRPGSHDPKWA